jgi:hypothetical protein
VAGWILEDIGTSPCLDDVFREAEKEMPKKPISIILRRLCNRHIEKLRKGVERPVRE